MREYTKVIISKRASIREESNHPWIFDNEIETIEGDYKNGDLVDVLSYKKKYIGTGYINDNSKIRVRIISRNTNDKFDQDFFERRVRYAIDYRKDVIGDLTCTRLIFGEGDYFSGLTIDKYNKILVSEVNSLAMEQNKDIIYKLIIKVLSEYGYEIDGIYERCDSELRVKEGLDKHTGFYGKAPDYNSTVIVENDIKYYIDFENGQKTGFFLDQKYNRLAIRKIAKNRSVLDCCTHTGSFAMNAYMGGAKEVTAMDISEKALDDAKENFKLNNMNINTVCGDVFDVLKDLSESKNKKYDFIILDPPAFTKSRKTIDKALKGYQEINYLALKSLPRGGYFATASCSHFANPELFLNAIYKASLDAGVKLKQVSYTGAAFDHPVLIGVEETRYLKFYIFQVV